MTKTPWMDRLKHSRNKSSNILKQRGIPAPVMADINDFINPKLRVCFKLHYRIMGWEV